MTASVTVNGNTYNDGDTGPGNLGNGGHRTNLIPMFSDAVADLAAKQAAAAASSSAASGSAAAAGGSATAASGSETAAAGSASAAAASAASAAALAGAFVGTSTTSLTIGTGTKVFTTQAGEQYTPGIFMTAVSAANSANYMFGQVTYSGTTLTMTVSLTGGSGTAADWNLSIAGPLGPAGPVGPAGPPFTGGTLTSALDQATGTAIASTATINLDTATGNRVHITGTTAITAVTLARGPRTVIFDGILTLTHHATTNNLPGAANITTAAGDRAIYESDGTTVYCVSYVKVSGAAVAAAAAPGRLLRITRYTTAGSGTWTKPSDTSSVFIRAIGGGGGGGAGSGSTGSGGGGGSGALSEIYIASSAASYAYTVGAAGAAAGNGGATTIAGISAGGGALGSSDGGGTGGTGGTATGGNLNARGTSGDSGIVSTGTCNGGNGGSSLLGGGGLGGIGGPNTVAVAGLLGGGGGGGSAIAAGGRNGAAGGSGYIEIAEYA